MRGIRIAVAVSALALAVGTGGAAAAATAQVTALRSGCLKYFNAKNQAAKYRACIGNRSPESYDAMVEGCYARFRHQAANRNKCLGR